MDVTSAFLNGELEEEIYMKQPVGFIAGGSEHLVCKLNRSIYGLKQSPRCWNTSIDGYLKKLGFNQSTSDPCIYSASEGERFLIAVYVDDLILAGKSLESVMSVKRSLMAKYEMKDMNSLKYFVGVQIKQDCFSGRIWLGQSAYCENMLKKFGMADCKPVDTPFDPSVNLIKSTDATELQDAEKYQSCVGGLLYLSTRTRPDISFAVGCVAKFCSSPNNEHWTAVKRIVRYLKGTPNHGLLFDKKYASHLVGYCDADWAGDRNDRKSTSGHCFLLNGAAVSWSSKKQSCVALSTAEAEYVALSHAAQEAIWLRNLHSDIGVKIIDRIVLYEDNQAAISITKNSQFHGRTKHIDIKYHFIRQQVEDGIFELNYCPTGNMPADILTKGICREKFIKFRKILGVNIYD
jgi:hypothetical protein